MTESNVSAPFLSRPDMAYKKSFIEATQEFLTGGDGGFTWKPEMLDRHFDEYVQVLLEHETDPQAGFVPQTDYWLIVNGDTYAGEIHIRHHLNDSLERFGGHIGYRVRPSMRRKGYGTEMCRLAIIEARKMGIGRILITCDDTNYGSQKIIEANGGVLYDKVDNGRGVLTRRYWIG